MYIGASEHFKPSSHWTEWTQPVNTQMYFLATKMISLNTKIFPLLLVLSLKFLLVIKTNGLVDLDPGLATIKLTTTTGIYCGGFYIFAQICKENGIGKEKASRN